MRETATQEPLSQADGLAHIVTLDESASHVAGAPITAVCGKRWVPLVGPVKPSDHPPAEACGWCRRAARDMGLLGSGDMVGLRDLL